jgi:TATA-binding protein-associated factor Taf7
MEEISPLSKTAKRSAVYSRDNRPRKAKKMAENEVEEEKKEEEEEGMEEGEELVEEEEEEEKEEESRKKKEEEEEGMEEGEEVVEEEEEEEEEEESRKKKEEEETVSPFIGKEVSINSEDEIVFSANRVEQLLQYYQVNRIIETLGNITHFTEEPKHQEAVDSSTRPIQPAAASSSSNNPQVKGKRKPDPKIRGARASLMASLKLMDDIFEFEEEK